MIQKEIEKGTNLKVNKCYEGETIEMKIDRVVNNQEPITDGAPIIYTDRRDGVLPEFNPRTDRWELALGAMDAVSRAKMVQRMAYFDELNKKEGKGKETGESGGNSTGDGSNGNVGGESKA